jgi:hypothetical protein
MAPPPPSAQAEKAECKSLRAKQHLPERVARCHVTGQNVSVATGSRSSFTYPGAIGANGVVFFSHNIPSGTMGMLTPLFGTFRGVFGGPISHFNIYHRTPGKTDGVNYLTGVSLSGTVAPQVSLFTALKEE